LLTLQADEQAAQLVGRLRDLGYVTGRNLSFEHRSAEGDPNRLAALASELVQLKPDVLVAGWGTLAPKALKAATETIPIVFSAVGDPVGAGLVQSLSRPGGNVTGLSGQSSELKGKQLQMLLACIPDQHVIGVLLNPDTPYSALAVKQLKAAADGQNIRLELTEIRKPPDLTDAKMDSLVASGASSLFVIEDPLVIAIRDTIIDQANRRRLPIMTGLTEYARSGGLMSYGAVLTDSYRRAADYVDRILKGTPPGDLPVEQPTQFQLIINLKTAKALGLTIPSSLLALADEVIE
jgi:putative ABC transport system substrate-binding protein